MITHQGDAPRFWWQTWVVAAIAIMLAPLVVGIVSDPLGAGILAVAAYPMIPVIAGLGGIAGAALRFSGRYPSFSAAALLSVAITVISAVVVATGFGLVNASNTGAPAGDVAISLLGLMWPIAAIGSGAAVVFEVCRFLIRRRRRMVRTPEAER